MQHEQFDVFLRYSQGDAQWVEERAERLEDEAGLHVWLDKWIAVPGNILQQEIACGLDQARSCAVFISEDTPVGWFREEIQKALDRQTNEPSFRVIPVLLPGAEMSNLNNFLELRTAVRFDKLDPAYAFHVLVSGIQGRSPGRWPRR